MLYHNKRKRLEEKLDSDSVIIYSFVHSANTEWTPSVSHALGMKTVE